MLRCNLTNSGSHYWNRLADGTEIDLTADQFDYITDNKPLKENFVIRTRDYVLSFPSTVARYQLLKTRLHSLINTIGKQPIQQTGIQ